MFNKTSLAGVNITLKDSIGTKDRFAAVNVTPHYPWVTNGNWLGIITNPKFPAEDMPKGTKPRFDPFGIPIDQAKAIQKAIPNGKYIPMLNNAFVVDANEETAKIAIIEGGNERREFLVPNKKTGLSFKSIQKIMPKDKPKIKMSLKVEVMEDLIKTMKAIVGKDGFFNLDIYDHDKAMKIRAKSPDGQQAYIMAMPGTRTQ